MSETETAPSNDASDEASAAPAGAEAEVEGSRMSFLEHLSELRMRLRNGAIIFLVATCVSFALVKKYFEILTLPAQRGFQAALHRPAVINFKEPTEPFWVYTKLAIVAALLVAGPFILWEIWKFVAPGLYRKERRMVLVVTVATAVCFIGGAVFGYFVLYTPALTYLFSFAEKLSGIEIQPTIMMSELVAFMLGLLLGTGVAFELPVVMAVLGWVGLVSSRGLWRFNKYSLILSAIVGGILTPGPDVLSQVLMAGPLFALYNISILVVYLIERARKRAMDDLDKGDSSGPNGTNGLVKAGSGN